MRLEEREHSPLSRHLARRLEHRPKLRRIMGVVVDDADARCLADELEPAIDTPEACESAQRLVPAHPRRLERRERQRAVAAVVLSG